MGNKVNYIHAINFINLFHIIRDQGNYKYGRIQKNGVAILTDKFSWVHFIYIELKCVSRSSFRSFLNH